MYTYGQQFRAGFGLATVWPGLDWETYSEAGMVYDPVLRKWAHPRGYSGQNKGLRAVGVFNYVWHPTFEPLSLAYDLLDGRGVRHWVPVKCDVGLASEPHDLLAHVDAGRNLAAFNVNFELTVWEWCVVNWGWPVLRLEQMFCTMAKAMVHANPPSLEANGEILLPPHLRKDAAGEALVKKLTMPKKPSALPRPKKVNPKQGTLV